MYGFIVMTLDRKYWHESHIYFDYFKFDYFYCAFHDHTKLLSSKAAFTIAFFAAVNHDYNHKHPKNLETQKQTKRI